MKHLRPVFFSVAFLLLLSTVFAQRKDPATEAELKAISERGRMLFEYDAAAWYSSDAVMALSPAEGSVKRYVGKKAESGWVVAYGLLNAPHDKFLISYEATQGSTPKEYKVLKLDPPKEDTGFYLFAARALETGISSFTGGGRPYNAAVLPAANDQFWVYLVLAQTQSDVWPMGADVRYLISKDGLRVVETRALHKSIIEYKAPKPPETIEAGFHTAVLDEIPEDTDVFLVLARKPSIPEWIATKTFIYMIESNGTVRYVMPAEKFFKIGKPPQSKI
jgi:hypothetical protein